MSLVRRRTALGMAALAVLGATAAGAAQGAPTTRVANFKVTAYSTGSSYAERFIERTINLKPGQRVAVLHLRVLPYWLDYSGPGTTPAEQEVVHTDRPLAEVTAGITASCWIPTYQAPEKLARPKYLKRSGRIVLRLPRQGGRTRCSLRIGLVVDGSRYHNAPGINLADGARAIVTVR